MNLKRRMRDLERRYPPVTPEARYDCWVASLSAEEINRHMELLRRQLLGQPLTSEERAEMASWPQWPHQPEPDLTEEAICADIRKLIASAMSDDYSEVMQRRLKEAWPRGFTADGWRQAHREALARAAEWADLLREVGGDPEAVLGRLLT